MSYQTLRSSALLLVVVAALPASVAAQPATSSPVLRVQGTSEVRIVPDLAVVRVGVVHEAGTAQEAQRMVNAASAAILEAVQQTGVDERQVQTTQIALFPLYASQRGGGSDEPRIVGYRASNTVSVRVEELGRVAPVIDAALGAGANQLEGVSFGLRDDRAVTRQALGQAVEDARGKADAMAAALGAELEGVLSVTEQAGLIQQPMMEMRAMALQAEPQTSVSPGEIAVSASVSIEYRLSEP